MGRRDGDTDAGEEGASGGGGGAREERNVETRGGVEEEKTVFVQSVSLSTLLSASVELQAHTERRISVSAVFAGARKVARGDFAPNSSRSFDSDFDPLSPLLSQSEAALTTIPS